MTTLDVGLDCACGGRLVITDAPLRLHRQVDILSAWFKQEHNGHGTSGVREISNPVSPRPVLGIELDEPMDGYWPHEGYE